MKNEESWKKMSSMEEKKPLGIYIHIPFCEKKCAYCDFLSGPANSEMKLRYIKALRKEIRRFKSVKEKYEVVSIFFGGGTPSSIEATAIEGVLEEIKEVFGITCCHNIEITIEANPGTVNRDKLKIYHEAGINRISFGLQSTEDEELKRLGRIHTYDQFLENYRLAKEEGFHNINVDLMSALPYQTKQQYQMTLERIAVLKPTHISAYSLIVEEGTPFYQLYGDGGEQEGALPEEEEDRAMYQMTKEILAKHGYHRYEISNYALEGYECKHNTLYWTGVDYLGFGVGASSYFSGIRYRNIENLLLYCEAIEREEEIQCDKELLLDTEKMEEFMFLGLRMIKGVSKEEFKHRFNQPINEVYGDVITRMKEEGLLAEEGGQVLLTEEGLDVSNYVMSEFLLDS